MNSLEWALTQNYHLYKKRNKKDHEKTQGEDTNPAGLLENKSLLFKSPSLWYFVMAVVICFIYITMYTHIYINPHPQFFMNYFDSKLQL